MKIALFGCGYWGGIVAKALMRSSCLLSVYDTHIENAQALAQTYGVDIKDIKALASCDECTGVYIAVPFGFRGDLVEQALSCGKIVLVEKPLHRNLAGVVALMKQAQEYGGQLYAGHLLRYHREIMRLGNFVKEHKEQVETITIQRFGKGRIYQYQDVIMDFTMHDISIAQSLLGALCSQIDRLGVTIKGNPAHPHYVEIEGLLTNGITLRIEDNNNSEDAYRLAQIAFENCTLTLDEKSGKSVLEYDDGRKDFDPLPAYIPPKAGLPDDALGIMINRIFADQKDSEFYRFETKLTEDAYKFTDSVRNHIKSVS